MNKQQRQVSTAEWVSIWQKLRISPWLRWCGGIVLTLLLALVSYFLGQLPVLNHVGGLAWAILIAVIYRHFFGFPETLRSGIQFASKKLLRLAIILFGLKLNIDVVLHQGLGLLARDVVTIMLAMGAMLLLAKWLQADLSLSLLLGIGTGVCGAAAIAAVSPLLKVREEDTAIAAGLIAFVGTLFAIAYTIIRPLLPLTPVEYGIWSGTSLHEIAQVVLAAAPAGNDGLAIALLAKLGRVFLLVPLCFLLLYLISRRNKGNTSEQSNSKIQFPWFLIGFILMSLFGSYVMGKAFTIPTWFLNDVSVVTSFLLCMAMIGLGLNVNLKEVRSRALRPLLILVVVSVMLSGLTYLMI